MGIRTVKVDARKAISKLLDQLDYRDTETFIKEKIEKQLIHPDEDFLFETLDTEGIEIMKLTHIDIIITKY